MSFQTRAFSDKRFAVKQRLFRDTCAGLLFELIDLHDGYLTARGLCRHLTASGIYPPRVSVLAMTHYEVAFKLQHECPYNAFSTKYPSVIISHWCNWSRDVLERSEERRVGKEG